MSFKSGSRSKPRPSHGQYEPVTRTSHSSSSDLNPPTDDMTNPSGGGVGDEPAGSLNYSPEETNPLAQLFKSSHPMIPFAVLTVLYLLFDVRIELFLCVALFITCYKANSTFLDITRCKKDLTLLLKTLQLVAFLLLNVILILYVYRKKAIQRVFIFLAPNPPPEPGDGQTDENQLYEVIFVVAIVDFLLKFVTIILKGVIFLVPSRYMACGGSTQAGKGWTYHWVELVSQLYRSLVPLGLWVRLLLHMDHWSEYIFFSILLLIAAVFKGFELKSLLGRMVSQVRLVGVDTHRVTEVSSNRDRCPICLDALRDARITSCMHVFCCKCIYTWCDRDTKCPICRTEIVTIPVDYRDGSTAQYLQLF
jgi:hypothetical protein